MAVAFVLLLAVACGPGDNVFVVTGGDAVDGEFLVTAYWLGVRTSSGCGEVDDTFWVMTGVGDISTDDLVIHLSIELVHSDEGLTRAAGRYPVGPGQVASFVISGAPLPAPIVADAGTITLIEPIDMQLPQHSHSSSDYATEQPLQFELDARADGVRARGRFELVRQREMDVGAHESCN